MTRATTVSTKPSAPPLAARHSASVSSQTGQGRRAGTYGTGSRFANRVRESPLGRLFSWRPPGPSQLASLAYQ
jgi:hypothetical protein